MDLYLDASALLRILFDEPGARAPLGVGGAVAMSSSLIEVESFRAVDRLRLDRSLTDDETATKFSELHRLLARLHLVTISDRIIAAAKQPYPVRVRALDTIHVATAELMVAEGCTLAFWTHDTRQAAAAKTRGLDVAG